MKCPKCGYHSFDYLDNCKKCSLDLAEHKAKFNLSYFFSPEQPEAPPEEPQEEPAAAQEAAPAAAALVEAPTAADDGDDVDFGFDFLDEDEETAGGEAAEPDGFDLDQEDLDLAAPFGIDGETVPADDLGGPQQKKQDGDVEF